MYKYAPTSEIICTSYADGLSGAIKTDLWSAPPVDDGDLVYSWGRFDEIIYRYHGYDNGARWIDLQNVCRMIGFPAGLDAFATAVGFRTKKDPRGKQLILQYCTIPENGVPVPIPDDDLAAMVEYCEQDVRLMQQCYSEALAPFITPYMQLYPTHFAPVEHMNDVGVPVDVDSARRIHRIVVDEIEALREEFVKLTGFKPTQTQRLKEYLDLPNVQSTTIEEAMPHLTEEKRRVAEIRVLTSSVAHNKIARMLERVEEDGRVRGSFVPFGAHTGRATSRGIQLHNMKKGYVDNEFFDRPEDYPYPIATASENVRGFLRAEPGSVFVVADFAQIECRVLALVADATRLIDTLLDPGRCVYCEFANEFYGTTDVEKGDKRRDLGKLGVLGCGYGVSGPGLGNQAGSYGVSLPPSGYEDIVRLYDRLFPEVRNYRSRAYSAFRRAASASSHRERVGCVEFSRNGNMLRVSHPLGVMYFPKPRMIEGKNGQQQPAYYKVLGSSMVLSRVWSGSITENIVSSIAAGIKYRAMQRLIALPLPMRLVMEVHDELVVECPEENAEEVMEAVLAVMSTSGADVCPDLNYFPVEGGIVSRYTKI